jgi:hypothetical protein
MSKSSKYYIVKNQKAQILSTRGSATYQSGGSKNSGLQSKKK